MQTWRPAARPIRDPRSTGRSSAHASPPRADATPRCSSPSAPATACERLFRDEVHASMTAVRRKVRHGSEKACNTKNLALELVAHRVSGTISCGIDSVRSRCKNCLANEPATTTGETKETPMQVAVEVTTAQPVGGGNFVAAASGTSSPYSDYKVIRRNGAVVGFEPAKISVAMTKAFLAVNGGQGAASARVRELVASLTETVL